MIDCPRRQSFYSWTFAVRTDSSIPGQHGAEPGEGVSIMLTVVRSPVVDSDFALLAAWREGDRTAAEGR